MKISHTIEGRNAAVEIDGDLDLDRCNCLEAFWHCHMDDDLERVELLLGGMDIVDGQGIARLTDIIRNHLRHGARVVVRNAPQMLAHTLYKATLLRHPRLELIDPREEEPYG